MPGDFQATVQGIPDLRTALRGVAPKLARKALRNALAAAARAVRDEARRQTPILTAPVRNKAGQVIRKPGTVRDAISVRTSKQARREGDVGVYVNVRPAKGAVFKTKTTKIGRLKIKQRRMVKASRRGANSPDDPFYWRFLEFGTARMPGSGFLQRAAGKLGEALEVFKAKIGPQIQRLNGGKDVQL